MIWMRLTKLFYLLPLVTIATIFMLHTMADTAAAQVDAEVPPFTVEPDSAPATTWPKPRPKPRPRPVSPDETGQQCVLYYLEPLDDVDNPKLRRIIPPMLPMWISDEMQRPAEPVSGTCFYPDCAVNDARKRGCSGVFKVEVEQSGQNVTIDVEYLDTAGYLEQRQSTVVYNEQHVDLDFRRLFRAFVVILGYAGQTQALTEEDYLAERNQHRKSTNANFGLRPQVTIPLNNALAGLDHLNGGGIYLWYEPEDSVVEFFFDFSSDSQEIQEKPKPLDSTTRTAYVGHVGIDLHRFLTDGENAPYLGGGGGIGWMKSEIKRSKSGTSWDPISQTSVSYDNGYNRDDRDNAPFLDFVFGIKFFRSYNAGINLSSRLAVLFTKPRVTPTLSLNLGFQFQLFTRCVP